MFRVKRNHLQKIVMLTWAGFTVVFNAYILVVLGPKSLFDTPTVSQVASKGLPGIVLCVLSTALFLAGVVGLCYLAFQKVPKPSVASGLGGE